MFLWSCAAGAGRDCAPAALVGLGRPAPQLHRKSAGRASWKSSVAVVIVARSSSKSNCTTASRSCGAAIAPCVDAKALLWLVLPLITCVSQKARTSYLYISGTRGQRSTTFVACVASIHITNAAVRRGSLASTLPASKGSTRLDLARYRSVTGHLTQLSSSARSNKALQASPRRTLRVPESPRSLRSLGASERDR